MPSLAKIFNRESLDGFHAEQHVTFFAEQNEILMSGMQLVFIKGIDGKLEVVEFSSGVLDRADHVPTNGEPMIRVWTGKLSDIVDHNPMPRFYERGPRLNYTGLALV